jgi:hypothetical protein
MTNQFWNRGAKTYGKALMTQYHAELGTLRDQLKSAGTEAERLGIEQKIARLTEVYREKLRAARRSLF